MNLSADTVFIIGCFVLNEYYFAYILYYISIVLDNKLPLYIDSTAFQPLASGRIRDMMKLGNETCLYPHSLYLGLGTDTTSISELYDPCSFKLDIPLVHRII